MRHVVVGRDALPRPVRLCAVQRRRGDAELAAEIQRGAFVTPGRVRVHMPSSYALGKGPRLFGCRIAGCMGLGLRCDLSPLVLVLWLMQGNVDLSPGAMAVVDAAMLWH